MPDFPLGPIQGQFKNRRKSRSHGGYKAEVFFVPKSASLRRRLPFLELTLGPIGLGRNDSIEFGRPRAWRTAFRHL